MKKIIVLGMLLMLLAFPTMNAGENQHEVIEEKVVGCFGTFDIVGCGDFTANRLKLEFDIVGDCNFTFKTSVNDKLKIQHNLSYTQCRGVMLLPLYNIAISNIYNKCILKGYCLFGYIEEISYI